MGYFPIKTYDIIPLTSAQATAIAHLTPHPADKAGFESGVWEPGWSLFWMGKLMTFMMGPVAELVDDVDAFFSMFFTRFSRNFLSKGLLRLQLWSPRKDSHFMGDAALAR